MRFVFDYRMALCDTMRMRQKKWDWRMHLTDVERDEIEPIEREIKKLADKATSLRSRLNPIRNRAMQRARQQEKNNG